MYNYLDAMKQDILLTIKENYQGALTDIANGDLSREDLEQQLNDDLWVDDSVTGNASGSYWCNSSKAKECLVDNLELVREMAREFDEVTEAGEKLLNEEYEWLDVSIRCYLLGQAIGYALDELEV